MLSNIGIPGLLLILIMVLVFFGPNKLPEIGKSFGRTLKEFKRETKDLTSGMFEEEIKSSNQAGGTKLVQESNTTKEA